jgi:hypothetical protein
VQNGDNREFVGQHGDGGLGEGVEQEGAAPTGGAEVPEEAAATGQWSSLAGCEGQQIDLGAVQTGAGADAFEDAGQGEVVGGDQGFAEQDADFKGWGVGGAAHAPAGGAAVTEFGGEGLDAGAGFGAQRGVVGQRAGYGRSRELQAAGEKMLAGGTRHGTSGLSRARPVNAIKCAINFYNLLIKILIN